MNSVLFLLFTILFQNECELYMSPENYFCGIEIALFSENPVNTKAVKWY